MRRWAAAVVLAGALVGAATPAHAEPLPTPSPSATPSGSPSPTSSGSASPSPSPSPTETGPGGPNLPSFSLFDCKTPPAPDVPGRGIAGFFAVPPPEQPGTSLYDRYGYAGLSWDTYDLGCGGGLRDPGAAVNTTVANWGLKLATGAVAATSAVLGAAFTPDFLAALDPLVVAGTDALRTGVLEPWLPVTLTVLGLVLISAARQRKVASSTTAVGWALLILIAATVLIRWPVSSAQVADDAIGGTVGAVSSGLADGGPQADPMQGVRANLHRALLYEPWLSGVFGSPNSAAAREFGPQLYAAKALTWVEAEQGRDPEVMARIVERKQGDFTKLAERVKEADPDAYRYLTGQKEDRVLFAGLALFAVACAVPFLAVSGLLMVSAMILLRILVIVFPGIAVLAVVPALRGLARSVASIAMAAVINVVVFGVLAALLVRGLGVILSPDSALPPWLRMLLCLALTLVMWFTARPFRKLTSMVSPAGVVGDGLSGPGKATSKWGRRAAGLAGTAVTAGVSAAAGAAAGVRAVRRHDTVDDDREPQPYRIRYESQEPRGNLPVPATGRQERPYAAWAEREHQEPTGTPTLPPVPPRRLAEPQRRELPPAQPPQPAPDPKPAPQTGPDRWDLTGTGGDAR